MQNVFKSHSRDVKYLALIIFAGIRSLFAIASNSERDGQQFEDFLYLLTSLVTSFWCSVVKKGGGFSCPGKWV